MKHIVQYKISFRIKLREGIICPAGLLYRQVFHFSVFEVVLLAGSWVYILGISTLLTAWGHDRCFSFAFVSQLVVRVLFLHINFFTPWHSVHRRLPLRAMSCVPPLRSERPRRKSIRSAIQCACGIGFSTTCQAAVNDLVCVLFRERGNPWSVVLRMEYSYELCASHNFTLGQIMLLLTYSQGSI